MEKDIAFPTFDFDTFMYLVYYSARGTDVEAELVNSFRLFDKDGSGKVNEAVIGNILTGLKDLYTHVHIDEVLRNVKFDEDGNNEYAMLVKIYTHCTLK
jgi:Ca2+-binding EF-hand superfamily protein